jgi:DNA-binding XRE family transcriptional regulator
MVKKISAESENQFMPIAFDPDKFIEQRSAEDSAFKAAYQDLDDEFRALDLLLKTRKTAGLTQAEVAARMGIKPASLARIEASLVSKKHSPTLSTLRKYAQACGLHLSIHLGVNSAVFE